MVFFTINLKFCLEVYVAKICQNLKFWIHHDLSFSLVYNTWFFYFWSEDFHESTDKVSHLMLRYFLLLIKDFVWKYTLSKFDQTSNFAFYLTWVFQWCIILYFLYFITFNLRFFLTVENIKISPNLIFWIWYAHSFSIMYHIWF